MEIGISHLDEMGRRRGSAGMLTPSPSLSGGSSDEAELEAEVDYDQAYRMLAVTLGFENSRDAASLDVSAGGGHGHSQGHAAGGSHPVHHLQRLHDNHDQVAPEGQVPFPAQPSPVTPTAPGAHGFSNPLGNCPVTMPSPTPTATQQQPHMMTSSQQPTSTPQQQTPQFMASMRNQGSVFPSPNPLMLQNLFNSNHGNTGPRGGNYNNPLVTFMRTLFQQQQQQMQNGNQDNNNSMANIFNNIPEQILMENMFNYSQTNSSHGNQQQHPNISRKSVNQHHKRRSASQSPRNHAAGYYNLQQSRQRDPSAPAPWGFYVNRDGSDVMLPPSQPPMRRGCPGNGEALLALPVFKQEVVSEAGSPGHPATVATPTFKSYSDLIESGIIEVEPNDPPSTSSTSETPQPQGTPTHSANASQVAASLSRSFAELLTSGYQYVMIAATSPATKLNEETLTYLNQGQPYEIKLKTFGDTESKEIRSVVRVVFHERRLQYMEREQMDFWRQTRPGERIIDVDIPLSYGIKDIKTEAHKLNCLEFTWDTTKHAGVFVKINCISTEFTPKKHGGEKGVPFRVQVESYINDGAEEKLIHCASCQVKIFKPKGADRKHKTDREKMEKRSDSEKEKFQPSYDCTVLTELPLDQVYGYLEQVQQQEKRILQDLKKDDKKSIKHQQFYTSTNSHVSPAAAVHTTSSSAGPRNFQCITENSNSSEPAPHEASTKPSAAQPEIQPLSPNASANVVTKWLQANRFSNYIKVFQHFSGVDLLRLTRDDLIQICGLADGIRLNNALQSKAVRPKLTFYVCQLSAHASPPTIKPNNSLTDIQKSLQNTHVSNGASTSPGHVETGALSFSGILTNAASTPTAKHEKPDTTATGATTRQPVSRSPPTAALSRSPPAQTGVHHAAEHGSKAHGGSGDGRTKYVPMTKSKRQHIDEDEGSLDAPTSSAKKQRTRNLELPRKDVFHAIYLETLTRKEVNEKMSSLFSIQQSQISESYIQQKPSGFLVLLTDDVIQNLKDESQYSVEGQHISDSHPDKYRLVLRELGK